MTDSDMTRAGAPVVIEGARVVLPDGVHTLSVHIEDGRIAALDGARDGARVIDGRGLVLAPALVDIHGDAFERQMMPRPGVFFDLHAALLDTDRQLAANGIATAYHALTLSWEPGLRSVAQGSAMVAALRALAPRLTAEHHVQLRWESFCFEAVPLIEDCLAAAAQGGPAPAIAFNDHTSMIRLDPGTPLQARPFEQDPDFPVAPLDDPAFLKKCAGRAARCGVDVEAFLELLQRTWTRRPEVPATVDRVAAMGRAAGVPMLSHDDSQLRTRAHFRDRGARIAEFPMTLEVAEAARAAGDWIVFGAPNAARGGSHIGSPDAPGMVDRGLCDILASDYFYPAMLAAVARLAQDGTRPLHLLWKLISTNPARASGLADRGEIAPGQRADLVLLDWPEGAAPAPVLTLSAGRAAYSGVPRGAGPDFP